LGSQGERRADGAIAGIDLVRNAGHGASSISRTVQKIFGGKEMVLEKRRAASGKDLICVAIQ